MVEAKTGGQRRAESLQRVTNPPRIAEVKENIRSLYDTFEFEDGEESMWGYSDDLEAENDSLSCCLSCDRYIGYHGVCNDCRNLY